MGIKKDYVEAAVNTIMKIDPSLDEEEVRKKVTSIVKLELKDPHVVMHNNVTNETVDTTYTQMVNWVKKRNPVISGNATFYVQPSEIKSPTSDMLRTLKAGRKAVKNEMFKTKPGSDEYEALDRKQRNQKVIMNAEYGASGTKTAAFYTKYSPPATTLMAQSIITIMAAFFEGFIGDNQWYFSTCELFDWMNIVCKKKEKINKWIYIPSVEEVYKRIIHHMKYPIHEDMDMIKSYIENCTKEERVYLYYANNLKGFILHNKFPQELIEEILYKLPNYEAITGELPEVAKDEFKDADDYNKWVSKEMFLNPYEPPQSIEEPLNDLSNLLFQYVYVEYMTPDSIVKLNNHKRNTVLLVDTDSNIINADLFVSFILDDIMKDKSFGRSRLYNDMILVNVLASCLSKCINSLLDYYGRTHNGDKDARKEIAMKNEFLFRRLFLMLVKKRYCASIVLREGNIMMPFKAEIKGMDFIKAGVTLEISKRLTDILERRILFADEIDIRGLMKDIREFQSDIYDNLKKGGTLYLKPQQYKDESAYKMVENKVDGLRSQAWSTPVFKGSNAWNLLNPDDKIYSLDQVKLIKLIVNKEEDIDIIKDSYPEMYNKIKNNIYNNNNPLVRKAGLSIIAIPAKMKEIPNWIRPLIDYDIIISDAISSFKSIFDALHIEPIEFKTKGGNKASSPSYLISL